MVHLLEFKMGRGKLLNGAYVPFQAQKQTKGNRSLLLTHSENPDPESHGRKGKEQLGATFLIPWELAPRPAPCTRMRFSGEWEPPMALEISLFC